MNSKISVCIPVYNGSNTIEKLVDEVFVELKNEHEVEIVLVNDASSDNSEDICTKLAQNNENVKFISLRRNYGEHNAVMCALNFATGDYVAIIDDDFQNPPSEILKLVNEAKNGFDVVYSKYHEKKHHFFRNLGSKFNDLVSTWLLEKPKDLYLSSFKVISKELVKELIKYKGPFPYIDGLILRATNNITSIYVEHHVRQEGKSNYTIKKLASLWLNMFINFSIKPLRVFTFFGMAMASIGFLASLLFIIEKLISPEMELGWTSVIVSILMFSGIQLIFLGLIGEYIGKHYLDSNGTPQWTIKEKFL